LPMRSYESREMYLENILILTKTQPDLHAIDIAMHMGYTKPSISRAMSRLKQEGLINIDELDHISLTESGRAIAEKIYERHTILSAMLEMLGVDKATADEDACRMEHAMSDVTFEAIKRHMAQYSK